MDKWLFRYKIGVLAYEGHYVALLQVDNTSQATDYTISQSVA